MFNNTPQLVDWTYNAGTGEFTALSTGIYSVDYTVLGSDSGSSRMAVRGTIAGSEINGSAITLDLQSSSSVLLFDNSFLMSVTSGQVFKLEFAGNSTNVEINNATATVASETKVFASLVIVRIA